MQEKGEVWTVATHQRSEEEEDREHKESNRSTPLRLIRIWYWCTVYRGPEKENNRDRIAGNCTGDLKIGAPDEKRTSVIPSSPARLASSCLVHERANQSKSQKGGETKLGKGQGAALQQPRCCFFSHASRCHPSFPWPSRLEKRV
jgi:hypothetical protein